MNCDQVFNILTRGPFPTGEPHDAAVEAHLEECAGCWQLAEALRPALDVFQEAVPPAESRDLPGYWSDSRPAATVVAELARQATRTTPVTLPQNLSVPTPLPRSPRPADRSLLRDVLTVLGFVAAMSGAVIGIAYLMRSF